MTGEYINLIVASTNVFGIFLFDTRNSTFINIINLLMITASVLMHLSERKHDLNGIYPFNNYSEEFLCFDRVMCYICFGISAYTLIYTYSWYTLKIYAYIGILGFILNIISELSSPRYFPTVSIYKLWFVYVVTHSVWHYLAYFVFSKILLYSPF